jgi:hypothetical protein
VRIVRLAAAIAVLASAGCGYSVNIGGVGPTTSKWTTSGFAYVLTIPGYIRQLDPAPIHIEIRDSTGTPVTNLRATADLIMPTMSMPANVCNLQEVPGMGYDGSARFTMSGRWNVRIRAYKSGTMITDHTVSVDVH